MTDPSSIQLTIYFNDTELEPEAQDQEAQRLLAELREMEEVDRVDRVPDLNPPEGHKGIGGFLAGVLKAEVNVANGQKVLGFLGDRLGRKPIELTVEANGKKLTVKANNAEELQTAIQSAKDFIAS